MGTRRICGLTQQNTTQIKSGALNILWSKYFLYPGIIRVPHKKNMTPYRKLSAQNSLAGSAGSHNKTQHKSNLGHSIYFGANISYTLASLGSHTKKNMTPYRKLSVQNSLAGSAGSHNKTQHKSNLGHSIYFGA